MDDHVSVAVAVELVSAAVVHLFVDVGQAAFVLAQIFVPALILQRGKCLTTADRRQKASR